MGGRWLELYDELGDDTHEIAEIISSQRGALIVLSSSGQHFGNGTQVTIDFESTDAGSTVTVTHDNLDGVVPDDAQTRWQVILGWYQEWATWGSALRISQRPNPRKAYVLQPEHGVVADDAGLKASRRSTIGSMTVIVSTTSGGAPLHVHAFDDEAFYVLEGTMTVDFDDIRHELGRGGFTFIPRGCPHAWDTVGEATVLIVTAPGGIEEFLHALHTGGSAYGETWQRIGQRFGYEML